MKRNHNNTSVFFITCLLSFFLFSCSKDPKINTTDYTCNAGTPIHDTVVLLVLGQSNAANAGSEKYTSPCAQTQSFYNGNVYPLADPLQGSNGDGGSVWSRLGQQLVENNFAAHVIVAPAAVGGTRIEQWIPGGDLNHLITETISSLQSKHLKITHVLWHQGESNHAALNTSLSPTQNAQLYQQNFHLLVQQLRALGVDAPVFPAMTSRCGPTPSDTALIAAQRKLANDSLGIYNGPNTDILGNEYRSDNCHFNALGLKTHAVLWVAALAGH
jgi:hypothetical protein